MTHTHVLNVNGKIFTAIFNFLALRNFAKKFNCQTFNETVKEVISLFVYDENGKFQDIRWDGFDKLIEFALAGIIEGKRQGLNEEVLSFEELFTITDDVDEWNKLLFAIIESLPKGEEEKGNLESPEKIPG